MLLEIRGTRLYVDRRGAAGSPPLLFVHGGPGSGSYDFLSFQGDLLSEHFDLIAVDQRGVQHSDPLDGPINDTIVIDDFEALRTQLGIDRWSLIGHSYGGHLALRYAVTHPDAVDKVVFENPAWDKALASKTLVLSALPLLRELGVDDGVEELLTYDGPATSEMWDQRIDVMRRLGDRRMEIYHGPDSRDLVLPADDLPEELHARSGQFYLGITRSPEFLESLLPYLDRLTQPALLIKGEVDPVTGPEEIEYFNSHTPNGIYRNFKAVGHFVHGERPTEYAELVTDFLTD
jgi:proline iminopeptidase